jgi:hypothetical protein
MGGRSLRDVYGYDKSPFTDDLRDLGFSVSDRATTPYGQTLLAVNAMLSMNYRNDFISALESEEEIALDQLRKVLKRLFLHGPGATAPRRVGLSAGHGRVGLHAAQ